MAGYEKSISHIVIGLKTAKGSKQLKLDPTIHDGLQKEKVEVGDVIYIEANSGAVKRQGESGGAGGVVLVGWWCNMDFLGVVFTLLWF